MPATPRHEFAGDRALLTIPPELGVHYLTPLGYPVEFRLRPEAAAARRPWRALVHDEGGGSPRLADPTAGAVA